MKFTIEVEFGEHGFSHAELGNPPFYKVYISEKEIREGQLSLPVALAHELGHVMGSVLKLPFHQIMSYTNGYAYWTDKTVRLGVENEAWDNAEFIASKYRALRTHTDSFNPVQGGYYNPDPVGVKELIDQPNIIATISKEEIDREINNEKLA